MNSKQTATHKGRMSDRADPFDWSGGHPALDLVNTLDERPFESPIENLATYGDLVRFAELARLIEPTMAARLRKLGGPACSRVAKRVRTLREHLHDVLAAAHAGRATPQTALDAITAAIQAAHVARALVAASSPALAGHRWSPPFAADIPLHACALADAWGTAASGIGSRGHINADSGLGDWAEGRAWLQALAATAA